MIIDGFGIRLVRLTHDDIELVRIHRNSENIKRFMEYQEEITVKMQEKWFASIDNEFNNYFIIEFKEEKCGLIYGAQIDWEKKETGNGGIFIWNEKYMETPVPLAASLVLTDLSFLTGFERTFVKIVRDNYPAIAFNRNLGYEILRGQENEKNQRYVLEKSNYEKKSARFRESFVKMYGDVFLGTLNDPHHPSSEKIIAIYDSLPAESRRRLQLKIG
ncbi:MAG: GNAT family N-acetyltransferase [Bacteroidetes bacterium]|nr:GNAT family N-acetyltransferase [Bacteroidota bacterium]